MALGIDRPALRDRLAGAADAVGEEVGEANQAALEHQFPVLDKRAAQEGPRTLDAYRTELLHVAAVAVAAIESLDRQRAGQGTAQP